MAGRIKRARSRGGSPPARARKTRRLRFSLARGGETTELMEVWFAQGDDHTELRIEKEHECPKCGGIVRITDLHLRVREHRMPKDRREDERPGRSARPRVGALGRVAAKLPPGSHAGRRAKRSRKRACSCPR